MVCHSSLSCRYSRTHRTKRLFKVATPTTISFAVTLEPIIGTFIGWFLFDESIPGKWTWFGGFILITGIMLVINGGDEIELDTSDK